jgi:hypothetical protein
MSIEALSKAVLSAREIDRLVEILTGAPATRTADKLSSLNRFKKTLARMLPGSGAAIADSILATKPYADAEQMTRNALATANAIEAEGPENRENGAENGREPVEATVDAAEGSEHAYGAPSAIDDLPVIEEPPATKQKGMLKRKGTGKPKPYRPDGAAARGRVTVFADKRLFPVAGAKPRKPGTYGERSLAIIQAEPGISYKDYIAKGGRLKDITWDVDHGKAYVEPIEPAEKEGL